MKYKLTDTFKMHQGIKLFQIVCVTEIKMYGIKPGDLGGYIEKEANLSQYGSSWVFGNAQVYDNAEVFGNAKVFGDAKVYDNAEVYGNAWVFGDAKVYGDAWVFGDAKVSGNLTRDYLPAKESGIFPSKFDFNKAPMDLLDRTWLEETARVLGFGANKYAAHNWRGGLEFSRLIAATLRHVHAFNDGEDNDSESGLSHLAHASCCLMFILNCIKSHPDKDDRYKGIK